ncbi:MAG: hypothetical protein DWQ01_19265 [Planctomycetota bacterium]|nr:MAG: hypothetical protein DWQ01_19265 [Planctomycetota bacterium]
MSSQDKAIFEVLIRGKIEAVWREITKTGEAQGAIFNMVMHTDGLKPGGQIRMRTQSGKYTGVVGEILEFDPPRRFAHTFRFTQYQDPPCKVIYELQEEGQQVRFRLIVEDMPLGTKTAKQMAQGGTMIVNTLKAIVENGKPPLKIRILYGFFKAMEPFSPASTKSEHWPL